MYVLLLCICAVVGDVAHDTGYPTGLLADCPGMKATTSLSQRTRDGLRVRVLWPPTGWFQKAETTCGVDEAGADCVATNVNLATEEVVLFSSGYLDFSYSPITRSVARTYLDHGKVVIILELFPILVKSYPIAARITKPLGVHLGRFLIELYRRGLSPDRTQLLGGSLGAHIVSFAAMTYTNATGLKVYRLTGLDPAGPCFRNLSPRERINPEAAARVDVLHTNIDGFGIADAVGHVDYYANGGEYQGRVAPNFLLPCLQVCSHIRAATYWVGAQYNPDKYLAVRCDSLLDVRHGNCYDNPKVVNALGPTTNFSRPGIYYLPTLTSEPYYMAEKGLERRKYDENNYLLEVADDKDLEV
ncbi:lipase member H-like [Aricia agestis]|uniref:lipase member H-like n=1 Tax=Aricia agestis TaxID=91739 RepID=UPI001C20BBA6|nr:lipase member H-like [Aricia agestis]